MFIPINDIKKHFRVIILNNSRHDSTIVKQISRVTRLKAFNITNLQKKEKRFFSVSQTSIADK